jgi:hypothetical protein
MNFFSFCRLAFDYVFKEYKVETSLYRNFIRYAHGCKVRKLYNNAKQDRVEKEIRRGAL